MSERPNTRQAEEIARLRAELDCMVAPEERDQWKRSAERWHAEVQALRQALEKAHEWLENVDQTRERKCRQCGGPVNSYFGLDHKVGENVEGCVMCAALAPGEAAPETQG